MDVEESWGTRVLREARERRREILVELDETEAVIRALAPSETPVEPEEAPEVEEEPAEPEGPAEGPEEPGREPVEIPIEEPEPKKRVLTEDERLARDQRILDYLAANGPTERPTLSKETGVPMGSWGTLIPRMEEKYGLVSTTIKLTGGGTGKRSRVAIISLPGQEIVPPTEPSSGRRPTAEEVRDVVRSEKIRTRDRFKTAHILALLTDERKSPGARARVRGYLDAFAESGMIDAVGLGVYRYVSPAEAAKRKPTPARTKEPATNGGKNGGPVPGTGRPLTTASSDVNKLLRAIRAAGGKVDPRGEHYLVRVGGGSCRIASTPSSPSSFRDDRQKLRRLGVDV